MKLLRVIVLFMYYSQEIRYFVEEYNNIETLEDSLENSPTDVALWITLARLKLHEKPVDINTENEDTFRNNIAQALSTLSRGLEENTHSEVNVMFYYIQFEITGDPFNLMSCQQCDLFTIKWHHFCSILDHFCFRYRMRCKSRFVSSFQQTGY